MTWPLRCDVMLMPLHSCMVQSLQRPYHAIPGHEWTLRGNASEEIGEVKKLALFKKTGGKSAPQGNKWEDRKIRDKQMRGNNGGFSEILH
ncbi:hypothetical protein CDAR_394841 [Caerostris darwini]|uniref:Uncharacterized protein n=1 Tax=Caerostris darwini TaxID=1538125 RepID=A0AAV4RP23_9ARAC|nr:hypothetical protein CDAR_394841 [Caerostris darwini]